MSNDDLIHRFRRALFARAREVGVSQACREFGGHRSTYYRWHQKVQQWGLDALRPRERRLPRMPNQTPPWIEQRVVAFALGYPGFGPRRIAAELARPSGYTWADLHATPHNPDARFTSALLRRVHRELVAAGWQVERITTDNGSEFRSRTFRETAAELGVKHRFIHAGRPQSNGCVERVQRTVLEECWRRSFARSLVPKLTALARDLEAYLRYYSRGHREELVRPRPGG
jgi:transposase InsO family protein